MKRIFFVGIGGTLMGNLAILAKAMGLEVSGCDKALYPPMSDLLVEAGITVFEGFAPDQLEPEPDLVVVGNAGLPRGHEAIEYILDHNLPYTSGAQWLGDYVLRDRWVVAISGTHGKTTTASMVAWILLQAGLNPGYLIGGAALNLPQATSLGTTPFFVVEADEYDTSYFDRRSKFVHYKPRTLVINNLEFDHADIFDDIQAIQTQFHNLLRTVPSNGLVIAPNQDDYVDEVLARGCWTDIARFGAGSVKKALPQDGAGAWQVADVAKDGRAFDVLLDGQTQGRVEWSLLGQHNQHNALAAIAAARHVGVPVAEAIAALNDFRGVKRRLELIHQDDQICVYDDFAHHPSAIRATLEGLRKSAGSDEIIAVVEPRTHTMSLGTLRQELTTCVAAADQVIWFRGENIKWDLTELLDACVVPARIFDKHDALVEEIANLRKDNKVRHVVIMSNGAFGGIYKSLQDRLNHD